jgi:hypothetical protein
MIGGMARSIVRIFNDEVSRHGRDKPVPHGFHRLHFTPVLEEA